MGETADPEAPPVIRTLTEQFRDQRERAAALQRMSPHERMAAWKRGEFAPWTDMALWAKLFPGEPPQIETLSQRFPDKQDRIAALRAMTPGERLAAYRRGELAPWSDCPLWAALWPHEVPTLNGEFEFIAAFCE